MKTVSSSPYLQIQHPLLFWVRSAVTITLCMLKLIHMIIFPVINPATDVVATRVGFTSIAVSWTSPLIGSSNVLGYEVFHQLSSSGDNYTGWKVSANNTSLLVSNVDPESQYSIFVVAYGGSNTLPSERSNTVHIPAGESSQCRILNLKNLT